MHQYSSNSFHAFYILFNPLNILNTLNTTSVSIFIPIFEIFAKLTCLLQTPVYSEHRFWYYIVLIDFKEKHFLPPF